MEVAQQLGPTLIAIIAILVTFAIAKRQIRAATVSASRQRWIDSLRDDLSKMLGIQITLAVSPCHREQSDILKALDELGLLTHRIQLLLNPEDLDHAALTGAIEKYQRLLVSRKPDSDSQTKLRIDTRDKVLSAAREVINNEWSKIKLGR